MQSFIFANSNANMKIAIFANERCRYMQVFIFANSYANMHGPMQVWKPRAYLLPLSKCTPAQRIRKTAFLKHPRRFGLQVSINIPVSKFFSPIYICVRLRRVLMPSYYVCILCVFAPGFWTFLGKKDMRTTYDWVKVCCEWQSGAFYFIHERCFFRPKIGFKVSISFGCEKQLKMSNKEKESPLIYVTLKQFSCI